MLTRHDRAQEREIVGLLLPAQRQHGGHDGGGRMDGALAVAIVHFQGMAGHRHQAGGLQHGPALGAAEQGHRSGLRIDAAFELDGGAHQGLAHARRACGQGIEHMPGAFAQDRLGRAAVAQRGAPVGQGPGGRGAGHQGTFEIVCHACSSPSRDAIAWPMRNPNPSADNRPLPDM